jgi:hypothetical protein
MTTTSERPACVSPALLRPLREWDEVWHGKLASELVKMERETRQ